MTMIEESMVQRIVFGESSTRVDIGDVNKDDITETAFTAYLNAIIESRLTVDGTETPNDLIAILEESAEYANIKLGTDFNAPTFNARRIGNRLKRCATCGNRFMDISKTNREQTCSRRIAYDKQGRMMERHGKILTECYRDHRNDPRRITEDSRSVSQSREVSLGRYENKLDGRGRKVAANKKQTTSSETNPHDYGYNGIGIILDNERDYFNALKEDGSLSVNVSDDVRASEVETVNLFEYDWQTLHDEYKRVYITEKEFNKLKEKRERETKRLKGGENNAGDTTRIL